MEKNIKKNIDQIIVLLIRDIQPERFKHILKFKKNMEKHGIFIVENKNQLYNVDVVMYLVNSRTPYRNLPDSEKIFLNRCPKPIILVERLDSAVSWFREFDKIPNLRAVFKNRIVRDGNVNNEILWNGRYHYYLMNKNIIEKNRRLNKLIKRHVPLPVYEKNRDAGNSGLSVLSKIDPKYFELFKPVVWDFHSSYLAKNLMDPYRNCEINWNKEYDVFCVTRDRGTVDGVFRTKAKRIVEKLGQESSINDNIKVITKPIKPKNYAKIFKKCKICIGCWGFGEWIHMDGYAMYSGVLLIKPDTGYVYQYPDLYQNHKTYIPCKPDFSDLDVVIKNTLRNYESYKEMLINNRKMLMEIDHKHLVKRFCDSIKEVLDR